MVYPKFSTHAHRDHNSRDDLVIVLPLTINPQLTLVNLAWNAGDQLK